MHLEFENRLYRTQINRILRNPFFEKRKGDFFQADLYCEKNNTKIGKTYIWGNPKKGLINIEKQKKLSLEKIIKKIKEKEYKDFKEIEKDNVVLFYEKDLLLRKIWGETMYDEENKIDSKKCRVIWMFGKSGSGKTTLTIKEIKKEGWDTKKDVYVISPPSMSYNEKIYFNKECEGYRVLVINEVDRNFPKHNNLISFIDKSTSLNSKKGLIKNTFEIVFINSLLRPEKVFSYLGKADSEQILRRIFNKKNKSSVLEIIANEKQLNRLKKEIDKDKFISWYKPIIIKHKEPDYTLIKGA